MDMNRIDHGETARLRAQGCPWAFIASLYNTTSVSLRAAHYRWLGRRGLVSAVNLQTGN
jgi:hypothetical protein